MSAVVYDIVYDTRIIKKRKNRLRVRFFAAIKEKTSQYIDLQKIPRF